jgi:predicted dehydrogenase
MQHGEWSQVVAIAFKGLKKAQQAAEQLSIRKAYGSYEELLTDPRCRGDLTFQPLI